MLRKLLQYILDRLIYLLYRDSVILGNRSFSWCDLPVPTNYPQQSQTHPSIIYLKQGWNGATHWLGTTPYPKAQVKYENPCIYYADIRNDCIPTQFVPIKNNPIVEWAGGGLF